ncbi:MAG: hypothetical protein QOE31_2741, partial [Solirubrobacteraceae bacterium]|nr:hypothetical protein [Solirubrobacteraceae bacterium]
ARVRLLEGVCAVIGAACAGRAPGIVFVDDVHAADEATIDTVAYLGRRLAGRALLLVVSWRSEAVAPGHRLRRVAVAAARSDAATIVAPRRLTRDDVVTLVQTTRAEAQTADLEDRVYLQSEGLPLFVVQYLSGATASDAELPADVHGFLTARVAGLGAVARQVLGAAAVIGRSFDVDTLRDASGRGEDELVAALEELMAQDVVREVAGPQPGYDFSHQLLRALVYDETNLARRRLLHRRVAAALSRRSRAGERAPLIAKHLRLAGDDLAAAAQYRIAAERAAELHAHADALKHLDAALALGDADVAGAHERIGDLRTLLGDYGGALTAYGTAAAHAEGDRASIEHKLGNVYHRRGEWGRAEAHLVAALDAAGPDQARLRSQIQTDLGHTLQRAGRSEPAAALASEALALAQASGDTLAEAHACNLLGVLARSGGDLDGAAAQLERSADLGGELGDELAQAAALNNLALVRADAGRLAEAHELTVHALAVCVAHGDRHREAALENNLADIEHARGDEDGSREHLRRAIAIFAEIETDESTRLPEIWKLASW